MDKSKEIPKRVCENPDCEESCAMPLMNEHGRHNFAPHIIDGEAKIVCLACKMKLLQGRRGRNGF